MCAAQTNTSNQTFGYTWGFAETNSRGESVVEISPNINYTVSDAVRSLCFTYFSVLFFINIKFHEIVQRVKTRETHAYTSKIGVIQNQLY